MPNYHIPIQPEKTYHILSRAVGSNAKPIRFSKTL